MNEPADDARAELLELARAVRGLVEWHEACGASGMVSEASPQELSLLLDPARRPATRPSPAGAARNERPAPAASAPATPPYAPARSAPVPARGASMAEPPRPAPRHDAPLSVTPSAAAVADALSPAEKRARLTVLADRVRACTSCVLCEKRKQTVFSRGNPTAELCFIGEGPGADEDAQGEPFVGKAGQLLDKMIGAMGMQRDDVYICNIVKCRPPENREPQPAEVAACMPYLTEQLEIVQPKVIVTLGNVPLKALFNVQGIMKLRGTWRLYKGAVPVMPTYHPAYVLRNPTAQVRGDVWNDLKLVMRQLGKTLPERRG